MAGAKAVANEFGLGAFAHAGRAEQDDANGFADGGFGRHLAAEGAAFEPGRAVVLD